MTTFQVQQQQHLKFEQVHGQERLRLRSTKYTVDNGTSLDGTAWQAWASLAKKGLFPHYDSGTLCQVIFQ